MNIDYTYIETPLGKMVACATQTGIALLEFVEDTTDLEGKAKKLSQALNATLVKQDNRHFELLAKELTLYFKRALQVFKTPIHLIGTPFQKQVWNTLLTIPYGETRSYKEQSIALGNPKAIRAVANANGANKISIIVPCHRVIGSDGSLTGYAGGLSRKRYLLALEGEQETLFFYSQLFNGLVMARSAS